MILTTVTTGSWASKPNKRILRVARSRCTIPAPLSAIIPAQICSSIFSLCGSVTATSCLRLEELVERAVRRELREEELLGAFTAQTEVSHEARIPAELHKLRRLLLVRATQAHAQYRDWLRVPLEGAAMNRLEAALRDRMLIEGDGRTRHEFEVRSEPFLNRVAQCV